MRRKGWIGAGKCVDEFELKNIIKKMKSGDAKMARAELLDKVVGKLNGRGSASYKIG